LSLFSASACSNPLKACTLNPVINIHPPGQL
jgi:hypothetical protein